MKHSLFIFQKDLQPTHQDLSAYQVIYFTDWQTLLNSKRKAHVILIDIDALPKTDTLTLELLRQSHPTSELLAISKNDSAQVARLCHLSGFRDYLVKPVSPEELRWSVQRVLLNKKSDTHTSSGLFQKLKEITSSGSPTLLRLLVLEYAITELKCTQAHWHSLSGELLASAPKRKNKAPGKTVHYRCGMFGKISLCMPQSKKSSH